ncbi:MAG TPA: amino acid adenylation domain-containing protein, partial [Albitalea sp.]
TPNGKVDRKALPAPEGSAFAQRGYEPPEGEIETALAQLWAEVLHVERVGRHDNFFELGGHSLLAVGLIERMRRAGWRAEVRTLFGAPTLAGLAAAIGRAPDVDVPPNRIAAGTTAIDPSMLPLVALAQDDIDRIVATVPGGAANVQDIYPLAPLQEGFLFHHLLAEEGDPYLLHVQYAFDDRARLDDYLQALQRVIERHDILRTAVQWEGLPQPVQVVWRHAPLPVDNVVLADGDAAARLRDCCDPRRRKLDVRQAPMLRAVVARDPGDGRWHLLLLTHHLVGDHAALDQLQREIQAFLAGQPDRLPPPRPFRDFVARTRRAGAQAEHEAFFRAMLVDVTEPTAPLELTDVRGDSRGIVDARRLVDAALARRVRERAQALGASPASLWHLAFALMLARLSGRDDVVFGTLLAGRMDGADDGMLGLFINTLPLRIDTTAGDTREGVRRVQQLLAQLLRHDQASLALAQRCSAVPAPAPLFTALLNYRHSPADAVAAHAPTPPWRGIERVGGEERSNYPFSVDVDDLGEAFGITAQVPSPLDPVRFCDFLHHAMDVLVDALTHAPSSPLGAVDVLPPVERQRLLQQWNATAAAWPQDRLVHQLFEAQAAAAPHAVAAVEGERQIDFARLNARANHLARRLRAMGVRPDDRVALCVERSIEMVVAVLAVLKSGAAYVPLDPAYPPQRLRHIVEDSAPVAVLATRAAGAAIRALGSQVPMLELALDDGAEDANLDPLPGQTADSLAYVIYTSGSTGTPKGVMIEHRSVCNYIAALHRRCAIDAADRVLQFASINFDASVEEMFGALLAGATLVLRDDAWLAGAAEFWPLCERYAISLVDLPTRFWQRMVDDPTVAIPACVRAIIIAGEAVEPAAMRRWLARPGHRPRLFNAYGPTETTMIVTMHEPAAADGSELSIGRPLANNRVYLLDARGRPVPQGATGELHVGGVQVGRGYLHRPELTAQRFVPDPFSGEPGARLYKTGDLARQRADGLIEFLGRNDEQLKIRGFRIEPAEVEACLATHPAVREVAVLAVADARGEPRLVAYYTGPDDSAVEGPALRRHAAASLPDYMVPSACVRLAALPLNASGKLDVRALPAPDAGAAARDADDAPQGEVEIALARIWCEVLAVERVGRHDDFFALGGHSLLAIGLVERMRRDGLRSDVRTVFAAPTLLQLAAALHGGGETVPEVPPPRIAAGCTAITPELLPLVELSQAEIDRIVDTVPGGAANVQDIYPLAPLQEGILFHHLLARDGDPYLTAVPFSFDRRERLDAFVAALQTVVARHDILRTAVLWDGLREPVQVVWRDAPLALEELSFDPAQGDALAQLRAHLDPRRRRLSLQHAPLMRLAALHDEANGRWLLMMVEHHLLGDHAALEVVHHEVQAILHGLQHDLPAPLPFRQFVAHARRSAALRDDEGFFRQMLGDVDEPTVPLGLTDVHGGGNDVAEATLALGEALGARLRQGARRLGVSVATLCHLGWALVLARLSGRDDVVFGTVLLGRMGGGDAARQALGIFINTLPLRLRLDGVSVEEGVRRTQRDLAALLQHEHASLALAQRCSGVAAPAPLFSALLNYRHNTRVVAPVEPAAGDAIRMLGAEERTNYPLSLSVEDFGDDAFALSAQACAPADPQRICALMQSAMQRLLDSLEHSPQAALETLDVLPAEERGRLLHEWNATEVARAEGICAHDLFEAQVARTPEAVALVQGECSMSYEALNWRANRLARHLRTLGVGPDARVGICVQRGVDMVVGLLATLKAGGAYVPLDPTYPA